MGKDDSCRHSTTTFNKNVAVAEITSFITLRSREGLTSFNNDNSANQKAVSIFLRISEKTLSQISYLLPFTHLNLKLSDKVTKKKVTKNSNFFLIKSEAINEIMQRTVKGVLICNMLQFHPPI